MKFIRSLDPRVFIYVTLIGFLLEVTVINPGRPAWALIGVLFFNLGALIGAYLRYWKENAR